MNFGSRSLSFSAVPLFLLWQPRIISQVPYGFYILRSRIYFTRFVMWISKSDFMLFLYHNNPGRSFAQGSYPHDLILRRFPARKYRYFSVLHSPKARLFPPTATQEISFFEQPFDTNFPPIAACCYQYYFSMFSSCIQYFVALSLLILRIRFQSVLRIFLLKYPIRQEISFPAIDYSYLSIKAHSGWLKINVNLYFFILYVFASSPPLLREFIHSACKNAYFLA